MYEHHFGLSGPPFQLNPDPSFYFDSRGHNHALAYLNFGVHQGEGFIVVTGEVGAGKTTLVRRLLSQLGSADVVAAQLVSTQLEANDLLRSVLMAFGESTEGRNKAEVIAALQRYLASLASLGRRALLVVDEAQNLRPEAVEELRMLSNFTTGNRSVLQSFLVGQPELRGMLQMPSMEQFKQRVIASCHLGPLDATETRAYVEHRLRRVGWEQRPAFEPEAFAQIHRWTQGIPRRINLLCSRLLLGAYLAGEEAITPAGVDRIAADYQSELGAAPGMTPGAEPSSTYSGPSPSHAAADPGAARGPLPQGSAPAASAPAPAATPSHPAAPNSGSPAVAPAEETGAPGSPARPWVEMRRSRGPAFNLAAPIACLVDTPASRLRSAVLARALEHHRDMPPLLVVNPGSAADWPIERDADAALPEPTLVAHLEVPPGPFASHSAAVQTRFAALMQEWDPPAVIALGVGDSTLACALVAAKSHRPVFHIVPPAGPQAADDAGAELNSALLHTLSGLSMVEGEPLGPSGAAQRVGSLMQGALSLLLPYAPSLADILASVDHPPLDGSRVVLVGCQARPEPSAGGETWPALAEVLCALATESAVVWPCSPATRQALAAQGLGPRLQAAGVVLLPLPTTLGGLGLLRAAHCLLTRTDGLWAEEAHVLEVPVVGWAGDAACLRAVRHALNGPAPSPELAPVNQPGADIVALLRRWRLRERLLTPPGGGRAVAGLLG